MKKYIYILIFIVLGLSIWMGIENSSKINESNDASVIRVQKLSETDFKNTKTQTSIVTSDGQLGVIAPMPSKIAETSKLDNKRLDKRLDKRESSQYSTSKSGAYNQVYNQNGGSNCGCACPYATKIVILGVGSTANDPEAKWFQENVRGSTIYPLSGGVTARINQIKSKIKEIQDGKCPQPKILIIGYSLGGSIAKNLKSEFPCVDVITIDPPSSGWCNFFLARWVSPSLRQICSSNNMAADSNVDWTNGNSGNTAGHYPWGDLKANEQKLKDLKSVLDSARCQP